MSFAQVCAVFTSGLACEGAVSVKRVQGSVPVERSTRVAAFFDVDNTLLPGAASELRFFRHLWAAHIIGWREILSSVGYLLRAMPPVSYQPLRVRKLYLQGKSPGEIEGLADAFAREHLIPALSQQALRQLDQHRRAGHDVVLVTGSLESLMAPLARFLGVDTVLAAKPARDARGYTGHLVPPLPYGEGKRTLIEALARERGIDLRASYAYGDSPGDVGLLEVVGHPQVVNPIRGMHRIAHRRRWPVTHWG